MDTCATCRFFVRPKASADIGMCRGGPPTVVMVGMTQHPVTQRPMPTTDSFWPHVRHTEFCAMHSRNLAPRKKSIDFSTLSDLTSA